MAVVDSSKMRNWQVRDAVVEDIPDILQMMKVHSTNSTLTTKVFLVKWHKSADITAPKAKNSAQDS